MPRPFLTVLFTLLTASDLFAAAGTDLIADAGWAVEDDTATKHYVWPEGTLELVNDVRRTVGWSSWFSECPNDICEFAFALDDVDDLPALGKRFGSIKAKTLRVALINEAEEKPEVKTDKAIGVKLALGSQARLNEWYIHLEVRIKKGKEIRVFGEQEYSSVPEALPPTLYIYVKHPHVDLTKLKLPASVEVETPAQADLEKAIKEGDEGAKAIAKFKAEHEQEQKDTKTREKKK